MIDVGVKLGREFLQRSITLTLRLKFLLMLVIFSNLTVTLGRLLNYF
jgi:hypothetical protein